MNQKTFSLSVKYAEGELFNGEVAALSSYNQRGHFDVLPMHANFITTVSQKLVLLLPDGQQKELLIDTGILKMSVNQAHVFLGVETNLNYE